MRCSLVLSLLAFLATLAATAAPGDTPPFKLVIVPPTIHLVSRNDLILYCSTSARIEACTEILGLRFDCHCRREQTVWRLAGSAQMIPQLYMTQPRWEAHETAHIDDLGRLVEALFTDLRAHSFDSEDDCQAAADFESAVFSLRMDLFKRSSNRRLH